MKENFDFDRIGKRLPYTAPDGFLDDVENSVMQRINQEVHPSKPKRNLHLWYSVWTIRFPNRQQPASHC